MDQLAGKWIGPMPVEDFIATFLPLPGKVLLSKPDFNTRIFAEAEGGMDEKDLYTSYIDIFRKTAAMPGFSLIDTSKSATRDAESGLMTHPGLSCYKSTLDVDDDSTTYEKMELMIECGSAEADPFDDNPEADGTRCFPFEPCYRASKESRAQISFHAKVWSACQHRSHCFILWIGNRCVRFIRIDRSGGIVSEILSHQLDGDLLLEFLWRFAMSSPSARGLDTTVEVASAAEQEIVCEKLNQWRPTEETRVLKMGVPDPADGDPQRFRNILVWGPLAQPRSVSGRTMRRYPAWNPTGNNGEGQVVFLKDSWRSCEEGMEKETDILRELNSHDCRNVPRLLCGDDIPGQSTLTSKYVDEPWNIGSHANDIVERVHIRFVEDRVGYHLTTATDSKAFLQAVHNAFMGHYDAYIKCGILHRDISYDNILIKNGGGGFLNDWDMAKHINSRKFLLYPFRSGTWQFMAAILQIDPKKHNTLQHDLESFFWVVTHHILRYMRHNISSDQLEANMKNIFDSQLNVQYGNPPQDGYVKISMFTFPNCLWTLEVTDNKSLTSFFGEALWHWREWYQYSGPSECMIDIISRTQNISKAEAMEVYANTSTHLAMRSHRAMIQLFEEALGEEDQWPTPETDMLLDRSQITS